MSDVLDTLLIQLRADMDTLRRELQEAKQESGRAGDAAGRAFGDEFSRTSGGAMGGALRDEKGRFVAQGREAGQDAGRAFGQAFRLQISQAAQESSKALAGILAGVGVAAGTAGLGLVKLAGEAEQAQTAFTTLLGSAQKAQTFLAELRDFAARTPFEMTGLQDSARKLLAFGFTAQQIVPMLTSIGDAVGALGGGADVLDRVTLALGQMQAKGKVSAEEMMQIAETGIPAWKMLADQIGVSIPKAMKMAEAGAISAATAIPALLQGMQEKFGGGMVAQSKTLLGLWSNTMDSMKTASIAAGEAIIEAFNLKGLLADVNATLGQLPAMLKDLDLKAWAKENGDAIAVVAGAITAALIPAAIAGATALAGLMAPLLPFMAAGAAIALVLRQMGVGLDDVRGAFDRAGQMLAPLKDSLSGFGEEMRSRLMPAFRSIGEAAQSGFQTVQRVVQSVLMPVLEALAPYVQQIMLAAGGAIQDFAGAARDALALAGRAVQEWLIPAFEKVWPVIQPILETVLKGVTNVLTLIGGAFRTVGLVMQGDWKAAWTEIVNSLGTFGERLEASLDNMAGKLIASGKKLGAYIWEGLQGSIDGLQTLILDAIANAIEAMPQLLPRVLQPFAEMLASAARTAADRNARDAASHYANAGNVYAGSSYGPQMGGTPNLNIPEESGKFGYAFISQLANVFKTDPRVASDCAIIAYEILNTLGVKVRGTAVQNANAGQLEKNAVASGFQKVNGNEIRPGDLIVWTSGNGKTYGAVSGKHAGVAAGFDAQGRLMVINNPGSKPTVVEPMYDRQNATVYRAPSSPFAGTLAYASVPGSPGGPSGNTYDYKALFSAAGTPKPDDLKKHNLSLQDWLKLQARAMELAREAAKAESDLTGKRGLQVAARMREWAGESEARKQAYQLAVQLYQRQQQAAEQARREEEKNAQPAKTQAEIRAQEQLEKALRNASRARLEQLAAGTVGENGLTLDKWKAAVAEIERRDKANEAAEDRARQQGERNFEAATRWAEEQTARDRQRAALQQQISQQVSAGRVKDAERTLSELKRLQQDELDAAGENVAKRAQIIERTAPQILAAEKLINARTRNQAIQDAQAWADEQKELKLLTTDQIEKERVRRVQAAYSAETEANARAQSEITRATEQAVQKQGESVRSLRNEYSQLAEGLRSKIGSGKVGSDDLQAYLKSLDDLTVRAERAGVSNDRFLLSARQNAEALYQQGIDAQLAAGAFDGLSDSHNRATAASQSYAVTLEDALQNLPTGTAATEAYVKVLEDLAREGKVSKEVLDAVYQAIADRAVKWQLEAEAIERVTNEALSNADALADLGDTEGAIDSLYTTLDDLYTRLENGEDVVDAINRVTAAINGLAAALELDTEFGTFVAGLSGTLSDQIDQVVTKLEEVTDNPKLKARLTAYLADLRGQIAQAYTVDPYTAGYINNGSVPTKPGGPDYQTIARARDLGTALAEETDPAKLQGLMADITEFLASAVGQELPEATRKGLEDGVKDAQGYLDILGGLTADTVEDAVSRGLGNAAQAPQNRFAEFMGRLAVGGDLREMAQDEAQLPNLIAGLEDARKAGQLTTQQLGWLKEAIERINAEPVLSDAERQFVEVHGQAQELIKSLKTGEKSLEEFAGQAGPLSEKMERLAVAAERNNNPELAAMYRDWAIALRNMLPVVEEVTDGFRGMAQGAMDLGNGLASIFNAFGMDEWGKLSSGIGGLFKTFEDGKKAVSAIGPAFKTSFGAGLSAVGGLLSVIGTGINLIGQIGDAILNLSPGFREWRKNLLEVADAQKKVASESVGMFKNPYRAELLADAGKREELANAGFWKRLWWGISGTAPQVLAEEAAKLQIAAADIFSQLGETISGSIESGLMNAFESGDWTGSEAVFEKSLNTLMAKMALQVIVASSQMEAKLKAYSDARAKALEDGTISADEQRQLDEYMAAVRAEYQSITDSWKATAPTLPGFGQGAAPAGSIAALQEEISELQRKLNLATTDEERQRLQMEIEAKERELERLSGQAAEGSIAALQREISELQEKLRLATTDEERKHIQAQIEAKEKELARLNGEREAARGSIAALQQQISELQEKYNNATTQAERDALRKQIDELQAQLDFMNGKVPDPNLTGNATLPKIDTIKVEAPSSIAATLNIDLLGTFNNAILTTAPQFLQAGNLIQTGGLSIQAAAGILQVTVKDMQQFMTDLRMTPSSEWR